jgi:predicted O-methyltransferase YrrM
MKSKSTRLAAALFLFGIISPLCAAAQNISDPLPPVTVGRPEPVVRPYKKAYDFSKDKDYFTNNIWSWKAVLAPYKGKPNIDYLEIGVFEGRSFVWMLENIFSHPTSHVTGIDIFFYGSVKHIRDPGQTIKKRFLSNVKTAGGTARTTLIVGPSQVELRKLPLGAYDIIYIDGSHFPADVLEDAVLSWRLLKVGGLLIFDDYRLERNPDIPRDELPMAGINAFILVNKKDLDILVCDYQVIVRKRASRF